MASQGWGRGMGVGRDGQLITWLAAWGYWVVVIKQLLQKPMKTSHRLDGHGSGIFTFLLYSTSDMQMAGEGVGTALPKEFTTSSV